jgi:hypothetical protein
MIPSEPGIIGTPQAMAISLAAVLFPIYLDYYLYYFPLYYLFQSNLINLNVLLEGPTKSMPFSSQSWQKSTIR